MKMPVFDYVAPASIAEAVALLRASSGTARPVAGGQSLLPMLAFRMAAPRLLVDLRRLPNLDRIDVGPPGIVLGAGVRWCDIEMDAMSRTIRSGSVAPSGAVSPTPIRLPSCPALP